MLQLARDSGDIIKDMFLNTDTLSWKDSNNTPLTEADTRINSLVIEKIREKYPDHGIIGEEESDHIDSEYVWICDPIDGTLYFSHHIGFCTFMLALVHNGTPALGVVYNPFSDEMVSCNGSEVFINDTKINKLDPSRKSKWVNIEYIDASKLDIEEFRKQAYKKSYYLTTILSIGTLCSSVARGGIGTAIYTGQGAWDVAAFDAILTALGGSVSDLKGNPLDYSKPLNGALLASPGMYDEVLSLTKTHIRDK